MGFFSRKDKTQSTETSTPSQKEEVLKALSQIQDPDLGKDLVTLGFIQNLEISPLGKVTFDLVLTTPACPVKEELKRQCETVLHVLPFVKDTEINIKAQTRGRPITSSATQTISSLGLVKNIIAVASGKGGVGKSTTAVNLACALLAEGCKVGLLDADIYGPSVPTMIKVGLPEKMEGDLVVPPQTAEGLKIISVPMFASGEKAQILRGPMAANMVKQFLTQVSWGELDYLIIDYPPGTGDIQLSISQLVPLTGAVIVTTPQEVALQDAQKAIYMFDVLKVPVLGIIETMSFFICTNCDTKHYLFCQNGGKTLVERYGLPLLGEIPIDADISKGGDKGLPIVDNEKKSFSAQQYISAAKNLAKEISILHEQRENALLSFNLKWQKEPQANKL
jgi:ATP-binding protein involved in chromosome partitioning